MVENGLSGSVEDRPPGDGGGGGARTDLVEPVLSAGGGGGAPRPDVYSIEDREPAIEGDPPDAEVRDGPRVIGIGERVALWQTVLPSTRK